MNTLRTRAPHSTSCQTRTTAIRCAPSRRTSWTAIVNLATDDTDKNRICQSALICGKICREMSENLLSRLEQSLRQSRAARMHLAARLRELEAEADSVRAELAE